jgi:hypothetical protein
VRAFFQRHQLAINLLAWPLGFLQNPILLPLIYFMKRIPLLFFLAAIIFACNKEEKVLTPKEILMASQWKKSEFKENGVTMPFFGSCEMDDVITFTATSSLFDDGTIKCSQPTATDTYFIDPDNKTMRWAYGAGEISFNSSKTSFTFKRTGANTFEYIFIKK